MWMLQSQRARVMRQKRREREAEMSNMLRRIRGMVSRVGDQVRNASKLAATRGSF
jgi:hypothetical protein